ncbi:sensor histidine kinase, partial [Burkholderia sp. SIMBA_051]
MDNLGDIFIAVINEIMMSHPNVKIRQEVIISPGVFCDAGRMGQLLSNLLGNAVAHGAHDLPIEVIASMQENHVVL